MDGGAVTGSDGERSLRIETETTPVAVVVHLDGELDASTAPALRDELVRLIDGSVRVLDLNLSRLRFVDSVGLSVLVSGHHRARSQDVSYRLVDVAPPCRRILEITRLDTILTVE
jgi:anti-sigma B factor antagonist